MEESKKEEESSSDDTMDAILEGDGSHSYKVKQAIGKGKFAIVYKGERVSDGETGFSFRINTYAMINVCSLAHFLSIIHSPYYLFEKSLSSVYPWI